MDRPDSELGIAGVNAPNIARAELLARGLARHRAGGYAEAEAAYRAMLLLDGNDADALHLLGVVADARGEPAKAVALIDQALQLRDVPRFHCNRGIALGHLERHEEALAAYQRALRDRPDYPEALNNLGTTLEALARPAEAAAAFRRALALRPEQSDWWSNLGNALRALRQIEAAAAAYRRAEELSPAHPGAHAALGHALREAGRMDAAAAAFRGQVALAPDDPDARLNLAVTLGEQDRPAAVVGLLAAPDAAAATRPEMHNNLATALRQLGDFAAAEAACRRALALRPDDADALANLGEILRQRNLPEEAEAPLRRALALRPTQVGAYNGLAIALVDQGRLLEALAVLDLAAGLRPADPDTRHHRAFVLLLLGRFLEGWEAYAARFETRQGRADRRDFPRPQWLGEDIGGKTILLHAEQGIGDTLQFCRYVPLVAARAARVLLEVPTSLRRLLGDPPGVSMLVGQGAGLPDFDTHCPLLSLPRVFGTTGETIPAAVPFGGAWAPPARAGRKIGIVWAGNPNHINDRRRSLPFAALAPLWDVPGVTWVSLQAGPRAADLAEARPGLIADLSPGLSDWADTAAALRDLDVVVGVDTAVAHLAGSLGVPVFLMLPFAPDWRWLPAGETSAWYPRMRLFRQGRERRWEKVVADVAAAIRAS